MTDNASGVAEPDPEMSRASFVNDCLLAASCREQGFTLITKNHRDFEIIRKVEDFEVRKPRPGQRAGAIAVHADHLAN
jgi:hypothetical protein